MTDRKRRAIVLAVAERKLKDALTFDKVTESRLRSLLDDLLKAMASIAGDDEMWQVLASTADAPLDRFDFKNMSELASKNLAPLLEGFGYREPPPPPVSDLVDSTLLALNAAARPGVDRRRSVEQARDALLGLEKRVREQIRLAPFFERTTTLRKVAKWVCGIAREYGPLVIAAAAAGVSGEPLVLTLGVVLGKPTEKVVELLVQFAGTVAAGVGTRIAALMGVGPPDPVDLHLGALALIAGDLGTGTSGGSSQVNDLPIHARRLCRLLREERRKEPALATALTRLEIVVVAICQTSKDDPDGHTRAANLLVDAIIEVKEAYAPAAAAKSIFRRMRESAQRVVDAMFGSEQTQTPGPASQPTSTAISEIWTKPVVEDGKESPGPAVQI